MPVAGPGAPRQLGPRRRTVENPPCLEVDTRRTVGKLRPRRWKEAEPWTGATSGRRSRLQAVPGKGIGCWGGLNAGGLSQRRSPRGAAAKKAVTARSPAPQGRAFLCKSRRELWSHGGRH